MKKKAICIAMISCLVLSLMGCQNAIPEMSEEQMGLVTEYAANLLLKYDANYKPMLLDDERLAAEEEAQKKIAEEAERLAALEAARAEGAEQSDGDSSEGTQASSESEAPVEPIDIASFLELDQISVSCNGIEFLDSYPESGEDLYFAVNASDGCKLAIIHMEVTNVGNVENTIDIFNKNAKFKVSFNGGSYHSVMVTLLENDFSMYAGTLSPGQTLDTILMVELKEEECNTPEAVNLYIKYNNETVQTPIL